MITRSPLPPCSRARVSMAKSYTRQKGLAQRPETKAKSTREMPPSTTCMMAKWLSTSSTSSTPDTRMNTQAYSSKSPRLRPRRAVSGRCRGPGVASTRMSLPPQDLGADGDHRRDRQRHEQHGLDVEHLALPGHALGPEIKQDHPQAVQRVEDHQHRQADLEQPDEPGPVGADDAVVCLGRDVDQGRVHHVREQVEENGDAGDPVEDPGPHALAATIERSEPLHPRQVTSRTTRPHHSGLDCTIVPAAVVWVVFPVQKRFGPTDQRS